ncbi:hypothetical protein RCL_jg4125.t1 [Rhizophagus clarus]|uniref:Crinkler effector protein N-terminal domain-containing protein n=1 Tax=Rhizophagus clarus TaxID=94130 RepID=A0A8H3M1A5_9GLOM|nr:hypothetical protein RCL_jg4125.t1 [Rhizophagus clarus]
MSTDSSNSIQSAKSQPATEMYPGQEALTSYIKNRSDKASYLSEELLDPNAFAVIKEKVKLERSERWVRTYWGNVVEDIIKRNKENQVPAPTGLKRKRKATEELRTIWCLVNGYPFAAAFPVFILDSKTIGHLKDAIREKINAPDTIKAKNLEIWKVTEENVITLDNIEIKQKLLIPATKIYGVFDEISETNINFIVKVPATTEPAATNDYVSPKLESDDVVAKRQRLLQEKDENVKEICKMPCPSTSACPGKWENCNKNPLKIYNLRPPECSGAPVSLFPSLQEFCNKAGQIYQNEGVRQKALRPFFTSLFDGIQPISIVTSNGSIDDDVLLTDNVVLGEKAAPILWEYKNEIGTGGKDPSIQGGCGYAKYWAQLQTVKIRNNSCCPSIILAIAENEFCSQSRTQDFSALSVSQLRSFCSSLS